jgi:hypothetical protein
VGLQAVQCHDCATAIPHYWAPCFFTLDPASLLITSHLDDLELVFERIWS